ncbi:hypothetical protein FLAN108750_13805 [Flavobacterium antarcticum]|uniref:hypothetical protein n=1 Tax=Flavobacterium antarcticum TaxID=271155 RepID=UPI000403CE68|nr:hypothetical protein [Flavobacterium antarcticum]
MKVFISLFLSVLLLNSCSPKITQEMKESTITYQALSRGFYLNVEIKGDKMTIIRERDSLGKDYVLNNADAQDLSKLYGKVNLKELNDYKGPTEKRFYDGAAIGTLMITYQGKSYNSQGFDHGTPPVEIADFINKIVSFTEK